MSGLSVVSRSIVAAVRMPGPDPGSRSETASGMFSLGMSRSAMS